MNEFKPVKSKGLQDIEVVPATPALLRDYYDGHIHTTVRAYVFRKGGKTIGVAGLKSEQGMQVLFSETKPDANISAMEKWRCAKMVVEACKGIGRPIYAVIDLGDFRSQKWIHMLGFKLVSANENGEVYKWPN